MLWTLESLKMPKDLGFRSTGTGVTCHFDVSTIIAGNGTNQRAVPYEPETRQLANDATELFFCIVECVG